MPFTKRFNARGFDANQPTALITSKLASVE
jgi:hypothetical protein